MTRRTSRKNTKKDIFKPTKGALKPDFHVYGKDTLCVTNSRGYPTPENRSPAELVVDATEGFIPLWEKNTTLRWQFDDMSMEYFHNSDDAKDGLRTLMGEALLAWGDASPVKFKEHDGICDFRVEMRDADRCNDSGCVLASAFFPDPGQNSLVLYPELFDQSREEQVETIIHEFGHIFGLRHFFANVSETRWASEIFGTHDAFSIMNYGHKSVLTEKDKADLKLLYQLAWSGEIDNINGTPIRLIRPFSASSTELVVGTSSAPQHYPAEPIAASVSNMDRTEMGASLNLSEDYIPSGKRNRPGTSIEPEYITIHNTDNRKAGAHAKAHAKFLRNTGNYEWNGDVIWVSWHYTVDDKRIIKHLPIHEKAYHARNGNSKSIGIETCMHAGINQKAANDRLARLVAVLRYDLNLGRSKVVPHKHWTGKACPSLILPIWDDFLDTVDRYVKMLEDAGNSEMFLASAELADLEHDAIAEQVNSMLAKNTA